ncbi:hypothetical protein NHJ6243_002170 [Beauveria neobassiana]
MSHRKTPGSPAYEKNDSPVHGASDEVLFDRGNFISGLNGPASEPAPPPTASLCISATLTALGSVAVKDGTPITVLGAVNTVSASILAFFHNSGIPDRYRKDMDELRQVEDHIKELLDSGIAPLSLSPEQIIAECFDLYQDAKATMEANLPDNYRNRQTTPVRRQPATPIESGNAAPADSTQDTSSAIRGDRSK